MSDVPDKIIFGCHAGGLGDWLLLSHLPHEAKARGAKEVYFSRQVQFPPPFKTPENEHLLALTPGLDGFTDEAPTHPFRLPEYVDRRQGVFFETPNASVSYIMLGEPEFGAVSPPWDLPLIGYVPKFREDFQDVVVADPRSISQSFPPDRFREFVEYVGVWNDFDPDEVVVLQSAGSGPSGPFSLGHTQKYAVKDIFEYCDLLYSAKRVLITESGGHSLAIACDASRTDALVSTIWYWERLFTFPESATLKYYPTEVPGPRYNFWHKKRKEKKMWFAQWGEDQKLHELLGDRSDGYYIDIGAQHPVTDSVTKFFSDRGWSGINVEPVEHYYQALKAERPRDHNLQAVVSDTAGRKRYYRIDGTGLSTLEKAVADTHVGQWRVHRDEVEAITLAGLCQGFVPTGQHIDFLKIDVEGHEEQVIKSGDWTTYRPEIVIVEAVAPMRLDVPTHQSWEPFLLDQGYNFIHFDGLNRWYRAKEYSEVQAEVVHP